MKDGINVMQHITVELCNAAWKCQAVALQMGLVVQCTEIYSIPCIEQWRHFLKDNKLVCTFFGFINTLGTDCSQYKYWFFKVFPAFLDIWDINRSSYLCPFTDRHLSDALWPTLMQKFTLMGQHNKYPIKILMLIHLLLALRFQNFQD